MQLKPLLPDQASFESNRYQHVSCEQFTTTKTQPTTCMNEPNVYTDSISSHHECSTKSNATST